MYFEDFIFVDDKEFGQKNSFAGTSKLEVAFEALYVV